MGKFGKHAAHGVNQFIRNIVKPTFAGVGVGIETQLGGGHYHGDVHFIGVAFDGCAPLPDGMVIGHAMEQKEGFDVSFARLGFRQDHIRLHAAAQHIGIKIHMQKSQGYFTSLNFFFYYKLPGVKAQDFDETMTADCFCCVEFCFFNRCVQIHVILKLYNQ